RHTRFSRDWSSDVCSSDLSLGFDVDCADAQTYLSDIEEQSLDGIFMAQVAEHLPMEMLMDLIRLAYRALKPGGLFVVETINVRKIGRASCREREKTWVLAV